MQSLRFEIKFKISVDSVMQREKSGKVFTVTIGLLSLRYRNRCLNRGIGSFKLLLDSSIRQCLNQGLTRKYLESSILQM